MPTQFEIEQKKINSAEKIAAEKNKTEKDIARDKNAVSLIGKVIPSGSFKLNDLTWYTRSLKDPKVNMDLSTFQYGNVADGNLIAHIGTKFGKFNRIYAGNSGVIAVEYIPVVGTQNVVVADAPTFKLTVDSAVNDAITRLKSQLDKRNSRIAAYANDIIGRYIFAVVDGIHVPMQLLKIALSVYDSVCPEYPDRAIQFIDALGFDPTDFQENLPNYKAFYIEWSAQFNESLPVIKDMSFIDRRLFMAGKFLADSDEALAQTIVLHPAFIAYATNKDDVIRYFAMNHIRFFSFKNYLLGTYRALSKGASWRPFIRDLRGGVNDENFLKMDTGYKEYTHEIEVVDEVLGQFHNLTTIPQVLDASVAIFPGTNGSGLLSRSLSLRGDDFENMVQGLHPSDFMNTGSPTALNSLVGKGFVAWYCVDSDVSAAQYVAYGNALHDILKVYGDNHIINRYNTSIEGSTMIDTRLRTCWTALSAGADGCGIYDDCDYTGIDASNIMVGRGYAVVPQECGTEVVAFIRRIATVEETEEYTARGFITTDMHWSSGYTPILGTLGYSFVDPSGNFLKSCMNMGIGTSITVGNYAQFGQPEVRINNLNFSHIDWLPLHTEALVDITSSNVSRAATYLNGELCMYYTIDRDVLARLHYQAALSEYSIDAAAILKPLQ